MTDLRILSTENAASGLPGLKMRIMQAARPIMRRFKTAPLLPAQPVSRHWGYERGTPLSRYFVDRFMEKHRADIRGHVLEIKNRRYADSLGRELSGVDVLDIDTGNADANIHADLAAADIVASDSYDCFMVNETLQFVYDLHAAVRHCHRVLKPGGVLLVTVPCTAQCDRELAHTEYWRFTDMLCKRLFGEVFGANNVTVETYGNFHTCLAGLSGMAVVELEQDRLHATSETYKQSIGVRAQKAG
jgi:SAM-dependent methyltransferase